MIALRQRITARDEIEPLATARLTTPAAVPTLSTARVGAPPVRGKGETPTQSVPKPRFEPSSSL